MVWWRRKFRPLTGSVLLLRLVALELNGFKSFGDPQTTFLAECPVVGPNGCGKSNITDALAGCQRQRASLLRGAEMSDVIFRDIGPLRHGWRVKLLRWRITLPGATKEIVISRRLYRDQGSDRVNGRRQG